MAEESTSGQVNTETAPFISVLLLRRMYTELLVTQAKVHALIAVVSPDKLEVINQGAKEARLTATKAVDDMIDSWHKEISDQINGK